MQRSPALEQLPPLHALALRLDALGADAELIAACLGITPESVAPLLEVAAAKLAHAERSLATTQPVQRAGDAPPTGEQTTVGDAAGSRERPTARWEGKEENQAFDRS